MYQLNCLRETEEGVTRELDVKHDFPLVTLDDLLVWKP